MSRFNLEKKLRPAKKAWKSFKTKLEKKFCKLKRSKPIKKTTHRINITLAAAIYRSRGKRRPTISIGHHHRQTFAPVYIDELFVDPVMVQVKKQELPVTKKKVGEKAMPSAPIDHQFRNSEASRTTVEMKIFNGFPRSETSKEGENKGKLKVKNNGNGSSVLLRGVDERAEEFIAKFREDMRLQREKSLGEYQEMLARGV